MASISEFGVRRGTCGLVQKDARSSASEALSSSGPRAECHPLSPGQRGCAGDRRLDIDRGLLPKTSTVDGVVEISKPRSSLSFALR